MNDSMRAQRFYADTGTVVIEDVAIPIAGPGEVLVKVAFCGICHSDLSLLDGTFPAELPVITQGHEASGTIAALGPDVSGWAVGDRVVVAAGRTCGTCAKCARGDAANRQSIEAIQNLQLSTPSGTPIPLASLARLSYATEQPLIMQRDGVPTVTVKAAVATKDQPATLVTALAARVADYAASLPPSVDIVVGGTVESSAESQAPIAAVVPIMLLTMAVFLMIQLQSVQKLFLVFSVAPLGLIGVVPVLLIFDKPMGFVAILGILALIGILIRNSIILVHEIESLRAQGRSKWDAVFAATDSRARPILLTAAAASLALIPISRQVFWGPMAFAMMGGIIAGTLITLLFVPALYCVVFGVRREPPPAAEQA